MRLLVCGGRDYAARTHVWRLLDGIHAKHGIVVVIEGRCPLGGADLPHSAGPRRAVSRTWASRWSGARYRLATRGCWRKGNRRTASPFRAGGGLRIWCGRRRWRWAKRRFTRHADRANPLSENPMEYSRKRRNSASSAVRTGTFESYAAGVSTLGSTPPRSYLRTAAASTIGAKLVRGRLRTPKPQRHPLRRQRAADAGEGYSFGPLCITEPAFAIHKPRCV